MKKCVKEFLDWIEKVFRDRGWPGGSLLLSSESRFVDEAAKQEVSHVV
jgi:hypothetical protein